MNGDDIIGRMSDTFPDGGFSPKDYDKLASY